MITDDKNIKNIIFDFGGVLLDIDISKTVDAFKKLGIEGFHEDDIYPETKNVFLELEMGNINTREFFEALREQYPSANKASDKELYEAWCALLLDFDLKKFDLIKSLSSKYNLYLLSNTNYPHRIRFLNNYIRQTGFDMESLFKKCYYSDEMRGRKPDISIYNRVIKDAGIEPSETIFIDDNLVNITHAIESGMRGYYLKTKRGETILDIFEKAV